MHPPINSALKNKVINKSRKEKLSHQVCDPISYSYKLLISSSSCITFSGAFAFFSSKQNVQKKLIMRWLNPNYSDFTGIFKVTWGEKKVTLKKSWTSRQSFPSTSKRRLRYNMRPTVRKGVFPQMVPSIPWCWILAKDHFDVEVIKNFFSSFRLLNISCDKILLIYIL